MHMLCRRQCLCRNYKIPSKVERSLSGRTRKLNIQHPGLATYLLLNSNYLYDTIVYTHKNLTYQSNLVIALFFTSQLPLKYYIFFRTIKSNLMLCSSQKKTSRRIHKERKITFQFIHRIFNWL